MIDTYPRQRQQTSLLVGGGNEFSSDGSDLYFAELPDDMTLTRERLAWLEEQGDQMNPAVLEAERMVYEIMEDYHRRGDVFKPQHNPELRAHLYKLMRYRVSAALGPMAATVASDAWLSARLAPIRGFPPNRWNDEEE